MREKEKIEGEIMDLLGHHPDLIPAFNNTKDCFGQQYDEEDRQCAHVCDPDDPDHTRRTVCQKLTILCQELRQACDPGESPFPSCVVKGCKEKAYSRSFCSKHYKQNAQGMFKKVVKKGKDFIEDDRTPVPVNSDIDVEIQDEDIENFYLKITTKVRVPKKHLKRILKVVTE